MRVEIKTNKGALILYPNVEYSINENGEFVNIFEKYKKRIYRSCYYFHEIKSLFVEGVEVMLIRRSNYGD